MYIKKNIQYQKTELNIVCHFTREILYYYSYHLDSSCRILFLLVSAVIFTLKRFEKCRSELFLVACSNLIHFLLV